MLDETTKKFLSEISFGRTDYTTPGGGAYLRFLSFEPAAGLHPVLWTADHTSSTTCRYLPPGFYTGTKLCRSVTEAHRCEQLAQGCYPTARRRGFELATTESRGQRPTARLPTTAPVCFMIDHAGIFNQKSDCCGQTHVTTFVGAGVGVALHCFCPPPSVLLRP